MALTRRVYRIARMEFVATLWDLAVHLEQHLAALASHRAAMRGIAGAARERKPRDRGDGGERFAAEAHGHHAFEIIERSDLAGGMPRQCERQLVTRDAGAIVLDLHAPHAAFVERHGDARRAGVQTVFQQLF
jgi:hypothetical protein